MLFTTNQYKNFIPNTIKTRRFQHNREKARIITSLRIKHKHRSCQYYGILYKEYTSLEYLHKWRYKCEKLSKNMRIILKNKNICMLRSKNPYNLDIQMIKLEHIKKDIDFFSKHYIPIGRYKQYSNVCIALISLELCKLLCIKLEYRKMWNKFVKDFDNKLKPKVCKKYYSTYYSKILLTIGLKDHVLCAIVDNNTKNIDIFDSCGLYTRNEHPFQLRNKIISKMLKYEHIIPISIKTTLQKLFHYSTNFVNCCDIQKDIEDVHCGAWIHYYFYARIIEHKTNSEIMKYLRELNNKDRVSFIEKFQEFLLYYN